MSRSIIRQFGTSTLRSAATTDASSSAKNRAKPPPWNDQISTANELGIPLISAKLCQKLFGNVDHRFRPTIPPASLQRIRRNIAYASNTDESQLNGECASSSAKLGDFEIPDLCGKTVDEHFLQIAKQQTEAYRLVAQQLAVAKPPPMPKRWQFREGWTKYTKSGHEPVDFPSDNALVFDVEVCQTGLKPTLAVAMSDTAWYSWCSKELCNSEPRMFNGSMGLHVDDLIRMEPVRIHQDIENSNKRLVIGHNVAFDRSYVAEQYYLQNSHVRFLDTMSMHMATSGYAGVQRAIHKSNEKQRKLNAEDETSNGEDVNSAPELHELLENEWESKGSTNSLLEVHGYWCKQSALRLEKEKRDVFVTGTIDDVRSQFQELMAYCATDVAATFEVFSQLLPKFLERFPHPATLGGMLEMGTAYLPINRNWWHFLKASEEEYLLRQQKIKKMLMCLADESCNLHIDDKYRNDPWLWNEDWSTPVTKTFYRKETTSKGSKKKASAKQQPSADSEQTSGKDFASLWAAFSERIRKNIPFMPDFPNWYRKLSSCSKSTTDTLDESLERIDNHLSFDENFGKPDKITTQMKIAPKLLRMLYKGYPLHFTPKYGWGYLVPVYEDTSSTPTKKRKKAINKSPASKLKKSIDVAPDPTIEKSASFEQESDGRYWVETDKGKKVFPLRQLQKIVEDNRKNFKETVPDERYRVDLDAPLPGVRFYKLPHKDGEQFNVGNPLAKDFIHLIDERVLQSEDPTVAQSLIDLNRSCSYWTSTQDRILEQLTVVLDRECLPKSVKEKISTDDLYGAIVPRVITAGTVTRRAVEPLWMTASNARKDRIASEVKGLIQAPPGYVFVGADVDAQEFWIASLLGDSQKYRIHGCTPFSWMLLRGDKNDGTDQHTVTAKQLNVSRDQAKVLNYGRIYGAGLTFATHLLKQFRPDSPDEQLATLAKNLYKRTKGFKRSWCKLTESGFDEFKRISGNEDKYFNRNRLSYSQVKSHFREVKKEDLLSNQNYCAEVWTEWDGGSESDVFNRLEKIALSSKASTPVLGCRLSSALELGQDNKEFLTSRVNWVVQSSGVDYLHLVVVCMRWLFEKYGIEGRFSISIHDEVRYLVNEKDKYRAALALQIANLFTRAMFVHQVGMVDLPQSVAYFSKVDIDKAVRKEVNLNCETPSNPLGLSGCYQIPEGEALTMQQIIEKSNGGKLRTSA